MPLTKANSIVINIDNVSTSLTANLLDGGVRDYIDEQLVAVNSSLVSTMNSADAVLQNQIDTHETEITTLQTGKFEISNKLSELANSIDRATARSNLGIGNPLTSIPGLVRFADATETATAANVDAAVNNKNFKNGVDTLVLNWFDSSTNSLKLENGYQRFPGGILIQWGYVDILTADTDVDVTFPIPFTTLFNISGSFGYSGTRNDNGIVTQFRNVTNTNFYISRQDIAAGSAKVGRHYWLAIGI